MKKPVVFFPGLLCDPRMWVPQIEALSATIEPWVADFTRDDSRSAHAARST